MADIEKVVASSYYTVALVNRLGERVVRSAFAVDAAEAGLWIGPGEKAIGIFSRPISGAWTVAEGSKNV